MQLFRDRMWPWRRPPTPTATERLQANQRDWAQRQAPRIDTYAQQATPLTDHLAQGGYPTEELIYAVCALERRVTQLENRKEAP